MRLPWQKRKTFFSDEERQAIIATIKLAEQQTSGEIRVFVEDHCSYMDALDRAVELFGQLKMYETRDRNAVLVYVAMDDRQLAIFGDEGIHQKLGNEFWAAEVTKMTDEFNRDNCSVALIQCVNDIGQALKINFPYEKDADKNELPDDIVFGR